MPRWDELIIISVDNDFIRIRVAILSNVFFVIDGKDIVWPKMEVHAVFKCQGAECPLLLTKSCPDTTLSKRRKIGWLLKKR